MYEYKFCTQDHISFSPIELESEPIDNTNLEDLEWLFCEESFSEECFRVMIWLIKNKPSIIEEKMTQSVFINIINSFTPTKKYFKLVLWIIGRFSKAINLLIESPLIEKCLKLIEIEENEEKKGLLLSFFDDLIEIKEDFGSFFLVSNNLHILCNEIEKSSNLSICSSILLKLCRLKIQIFDEITPFLVSFIYGYNEECRINAIKTISHVLKSGVSVIDMIIENNLIEYFTCFIIKDCPQLQVSTYELMSYLCVYSEIIFQQFYEYGTISQAKFSLLHSSDIVIEAAIAFFLIWSTEKSKYTDILFQQLEGLCFDSIVERCSYSSKRSIFQFLVAISNSDSTNAHLFFTVDLLINIIDNSSTYEPFFLKELYTAFFKALSIYQITNPEYAESMKHIWDEAVFSGEIDL